MSMHLDLLLSNDWNVKAAHQDLGSVDETTLRYDVFLGDLVFQVNGVDFSARWGWIPLLDLAYGLKDMCDEIVSGEPETTFEFTESDAWLRLSRRGDAVEISASYVPETTLTEMRELCVSLTSAAREFFTRLEAHSPGIASNSSFQLMRDRVLATPNPNPKQIDGGRPN
jgi:hypothetical protein